VDRDVASTQPTCSVMRRDIRSAARSAITRNATPTSASGIIDRWMRASNSVKGTLTATRHCQPGTCTRLVVTRWLSKETASNTPCRPARTCDITEAGTSHPTKPAAFHECATALPRASITVAAQPGGGLCAATSRPRVSVRSAMRRQ
jgi:hypothetical protein